MHHLYPSHYISTCAHNIVYKEDLNKVFLKNIFYTICKACSLINFSADGEVIEVQGVTRRGQTGTTNPQGFDIDDSEFVAASEGRLAWFLCHATSNKGVHFFLVLIPLVLM